MAGVSSSSPPASHARLLDFERLEVTVIAALATSD